MRDALSLTDQALSLAAGRITSETVREALGLVPEEEYLALLALIAERRAADVFPAMARLAESGVDFGVLLAGLADTLRAQLSVSLGGRATEMSEAASDTLVALKDRLAASDVVRMLTAIAELEPRFKRSTQQRLLLETLLVRFALLDRAVALEDVIRSLGGGGDGGSAPSPPSGGGAVTRGASAPPRREERPPSRLASVRSEAAPMADTRPAPDARGPAAATTVASRPLAASFTAAPAVVIDPPPAETGRPAAPQALDLNHLVENWDDIVEQVRAAGRGMLASALADALPTAVSRSGVITLQLDSAHEGDAEVVERALDGGAAELLAIIGRRFSGVTRVALRRADQPAPPTGGRRLTEDALRADKMAKLRKRDPLLGRAIDALDLDLIE
jgi:DNA polymerase-3 subunit gamma/tau